MHRHILACNRRERSEAVRAPACVGTVEDAHSVIKTNKFVVFGGAGCLNKEIAHGKVMVPTEAYRDEGTSYHYAPAADYVAVNHADEVASFMKDVDERRFARCP